MSHYEGDKIPGLDGFNFSFLKKFCPLLIGNIGIMYDQFHRFASLSQRFASYFVTLIQKVHSHSHMGEFRPISLVIYLYKLVVKVLAIKHGSMIEKLISPNQSTFLKGRLLTDGVVAINEVLDLAKNPKDRALFLRWILRKHMIHLVGVF